LTAGPAPVAAHAFTCQRQSAPEAAEKARTDG